MPNKIIVHLGDRSYPVFIMRDRFRSLGSWIKKMGLGEELFIISNPEARKRFGKFVKDSLRRSRIQTYFTKVKFPKGKTLEQAKSQKYVNFLIEELLQRSRKGKPIVLASLSGGVLGDLTGYAAAIFKRGIPYIHIPTTLLSQVDSSIGGKVGIDHPSAKNLLGAFYQPRLVYIELSIFKDLSPKDLESVRDGLAEVVKYGAIADPALFSFLEKNYKKLLKRDPDQDTLEHVIRSCALIKAKVVSLDERDNKGKRIILNFGHTLGHAIEQAKGYKIRHGHAISVGMVCAAEIAEKCRLCDRGTPERLEGLLSNLGLPTKMKGVSIEKLLKAEALDKKFVRGRNRYVLPVRIGRVVVQENIPYATIRNVLSKRIDA